MSDETEPGVFPTDPAPEISEAEFPVPQSMLDWEAEHIPAPEEEAPE